MGRKKKTDGEDGPKKPEKEPWWFDDPYDNTLPWGAPIVTEKEIADAIDKAPPLSYFQDKMKDEIPKKKRTRRRKNEWDDLLKDPLVDLRKGLEFLKQNNQRKQQELNEKTQLRQCETHADASYSKSVENISAVKENSDSKAVKDTFTIRKDLRDDIAKENIRSDQQDCSTANNNDPEKLSKSPNKPMSSASPSDSKSEIKNIKKPKKKEKYNLRVTELTKELAALKSQIALLTKVVTSGATFNPMERKQGEMSSNKDMLSDSKEKENVQLKTAEKSTTIVSTDDSKSKNEKDGVKEALGGSKEKEYVKRNSDRNVESNYPNEPLRSGAISDMTNENNSRIRKTHVGLVENESVKPEILETGPISSNEKTKSASKNESNKKKNIKSKKKEKRKAKDEKMLKKFFKNFKDEDFSNDATPGGSHEHNFIKPEGKGHTTDFSRMGPYPQNAGDPQNLSETSQIPLDSEFLSDMKHSFAKACDGNISKFLNSTLRPGDGFVLDFDKNDKN